MQQLQVVEHSNMRVLTTTQLAEAFATNGKAILRNFQRNQERYVSGVHYIALSGEELKRFKAERQNDVSLKYVSVLYLWSEQGALMLAKSLSSDLAWKAYQMLVDTYYETRSQGALSKGGDNKTLAITHEQVYQIESRLDALEQQLRETVTLHSGEQRRLRNAVGEQVQRLASNSKGARPVLFRSLYTAIRERYEVESYRDVRQHELQDALLFISEWGISSEYEKGCD